MSLAGMVFVYILMQLTIWWVLHTAVFFWKVQFPFHSHQSFYEPQRVKCIHITCVTVGLLFPLVPIIASVADSAADWQSDTSTNVSFLKSGLGFGQTRFPAILCTSTDEDVTFYSFVLPINLILAIGCSLLTVVFWTLHKVRYNYTCEVAHVVNCFFHRYCTLSVLTHSTLSHISIPIYLLYIFHLLLYTPTLSSTSCSVDFFKQSF